MAATTASAGGWTVNTVTYSQAGKLPLLADIYTATTHSTNTTPRPVYLFFHGGALIFGDRQSWPPAYLFQPLVVQRGWTVVSFDYRLLPESTLEDINTDLLAVEQFVVEKLNHTLTSLHLPIVDLSQLVVGGASAGGYLALQAGHLFKQLQPRALAALYPMTFTSVEWYGQPHPEARPMGFFVPDVIDEVAVARLLTERGEPISGYPLGDWKQPRFALYRLLINRGQYYQLALGSNTAPAELPADKQRLLPALNITATYPPTLLVHGSADTTVPVVESEQLAVVLAGAGVEHTFLRVEGREHGLDAMPDGDDVEAARTTVVDFVLRHVKQQ